MQRAVLNLALISSVGRWHGRNHLFYSIGIANNFACLLCALKCLQPEDQEIALQRPAHTSQSALYAHMLVLEAYSMDMKSKGHLQNALACLVF